MNSTQVVDLMVASDGVEPPPAFQSWFNLGRPPFLDGQRPVILRVKSRQTRMVPVTAA